MRCKHECPICGEEFEHGCDSQPVEPLGLCLILQNCIDYMPKCEKQDYFLECSSCILTKELNK